LLLDMPDLPRSLSGRALKTSRKTLNRDAAQLARSRPAHG
jgi:hypothetical protein